MAVKTVCDFCGKEIEAQDTQPFEFLRKVTIYLRASKSVVQAGGGNRMEDVDICAGCRADAAKSQDPRPQPACPLPWAVIINGIRCPGPHARFSQEHTAREFAATCPQGAKVEYRP